MWKHYVLCDPRITDDLACVRYVGRTRCLLKCRLSALLADARKGCSSPVHAWIRGLLREGHSPELIYIEDGGKDHEEQLIQEYLKAGVVLLNCNKGGAGT